MSKESVDKQVTAKDQGVVQAPSNVAVSLSTVNGYVEAKKNDDGSYTTTLNVDFGKGKQSFDIEHDSAIEIAKTAGIREIKTTDGMIVPLNSNAVAEIVDNLYDNVNLKSVNIDTDSHKNGAVNAAPDEKPYTVNALAPATVTDWETNKSSNRKNGQIVAEPNTSTKVKANDTGKVGSGNGNDAAIGTGEGANSRNGGSAIGDGTGYGTGNVTDNIKSSSNNDTKQSTQKIDAGEKLDDATAASNYAYNTRNGAINHIFHNNFYQHDPVPAWSFSVDFIPLCMKDKRFQKLFTFEDSKTLTKAVLNITANEKTINTQSINYLGLQHPFFTKLAQSHGDLKIVFAEDELFSISTILKNVLKYASYLPNFPTNKVYEVKDGKWGDQIIAHAASDTIASRYRLNATNVNVDEENIGSLVHDYKFVFDILLKIYKAENAHIFADEAAPPGFVYHFHKCWLKNVGGIELNYDNDTPIDRPTIFSYQYMSGVPYYEWVSRNRVISDSERLTEAYNETARQVADAASSVVQEAKEYLKNSPSSFTDDGEPASTQLNNFLNDTKSNPKLKYLFN